MLTQNNIIQFLKREGDLGFWRAIFFIAVLSGIANSGLLAIINIATSTVENEGLNYQFFSMFIVVFLIFIITKKYSMVKSSQEVERIIKNTRDRISNKIRFCELHTIETLDKTMILTRLTRDTNAISQAARILILRLQSIIMIFFTLLYILYLSVPIFMIILLFIILVSLNFATFKKELREDRDEVNIVEDQFFSSLNSMMNGFKELKMNSQKSEDIASQHAQFSYNLSNLKVDLSNKLTINAMYMGNILYLILATIVFIMPHIEAESSTTIIQVTAAVLFIVGPFEATVNVIPLIAKTILAIENISKIEELLDDKTSNHYVFDEHTIKRFNNFKTITFKNIEYYYTNKENEKVFGVGPIDFTLNRGEIIFIIGGNGSGKSTFIKTLLRLYTQTKGEIELDSNIIDEYNTQVYRDLFSIILTDFYIFEQIYGNKNINYKLLNDLLVETQLNNKTKYIDGKFTTTNLSTGQKKRLALVIAILEDKPILVLDEWAADQDPEFRKYFYETILMRLQQQGKTIIAVTHDDAYFKFSDKVFKMDSGQLVPYIAH